MIGGFIQEILDAEKQAADIKLDAATAIRKVEDKNLNDIEKMRKAYLALSVENNAAEEHETAPTGRAKKLTVDEDRIKSAKKFIMDNLVGGGDI
jgi:hypothetical protein